MMMKKLVLILINLTLCLLAYSQTGESIIAKYKVEAGVKYFNVDAKEICASLDENRLREETNPFLQDSFIDKFIGGVKDVKHIEMLIVQKEQKDLLSKIYIDVKSLATNGYIIVSGNKKNDLCCAKSNGKGISEIVLLKKQKDQGHKIVLAVVKI
ncbi:MAG: hypothetical protein PUH24_07960 [Prevotellaceae bacterium]|nr:hypothetical protein [Prevotellaceae bacterium]MDY6130284.1 hypothetical protein [Prevotella sp.]